MHRGGGRGEHRQAELPSPPAARPAATASARMRTARRRRRRRRSSRVGQLHQAHRVEPADLDVVGDAEADPRRRPRYRSRRGSRRPSRSTARRYGAISATRCAPSADRPARSATGAGHDRHVVPGAGGPGEPAPRRLVRAGALGHDRDQAGVREHVAPGVGQLGGAAGRRRVHPGQLLRRDLAHGHPAGVGGEPLGVTGSRRRSSSGHLGLHRGVGAGHDQADPVAAHASPPRTRGPAAGARPTRPSATSKPSGAAIRRTSSTCSEPCRSTVSTGRPSARDPERGTTAGSPTSGGTADTRRGRRPRPGAPAPRGSVDVARSRRRCPAPSSAPAPRPRRSDGATGCPR